MAKVSFDQLLALYKNVAFDPEGDEGDLRIASDEILRILTFLEADDDAAADANFVVLDELAGLAVGRTVRVRARAPRLALGFLVRDIDGLLNVPEGRLTEPKAYFVIAGAITKDMNPSPPALVAYRKALEVVGLVTEAAAYLDRPQRELIFLKDGKFPVPIRFGAEDLTRLSSADADELMRSFADQTHRDQKLAILAETVVQLVGAQPLGGRFRYLLANLSSLTDEVRKGYRLFASSFSYAKIRSDLETARIDYLNKIHKTLIDIQSQLLGIPVATIIVASQLKVVTACGLEFWTNLAVIAGAWIFVVLLAIAIINQWATLSSIARDVRKQQTKLATDYSTLSEEFTDIFQSLTRRILWQRCVLGFIALMAAAGACFATYVAHRLTPVDAAACFRGDTAPDGASKVPGVPMTPAPSKQPEAASPGRPEQPKPPTGGAPSGQGAPAH